jgi:hypothetical protein
MGKGGLTSVLELKVSDFIGIALMVERSSTSGFYTAQTGSYIAGDMIVHQLPRYADSKSIKR